MLNKKKRKKLLKKSFPKSIEKLETLSIQTLIIVMNE